MATVKAKQSASTPVLRTRASCPDNHGRLKLGSSPDSLLSSPTSTRSSPTKSSGSPVRGTLPKSFVKSFAQLTLQQETSCRAHIDHSQAFTKIFEKRSSTVPRAPTLQTERRALVRSKSPPKMAGAKGPGKAPNSNGGRDSSYRGNRELTPASEQGALDLCRHIHRRNFRRNTQPVTGRDGEQPDGYSNPPSSPISPGSTPPRDSLSPEKPDDPHQRDDLKKKRRDEDDDSSGNGNGGTKASGSGTTLNGKGQTAIDGHSGRKSGTTTNSNSTQATTAAGSGFNMYCLNASAPWFIPENGRFEQLLPRDRLIHTANWYKEEGKIPCGFSERAKFNQGRYSCSRI